MSEALKSVESAPLRLDPRWRVTDREEGAKVHALRVVTANARPAAKIPDDELRALVADVLRTELRSDLGRRMTGSIRQLVREEVARVLSSLGKR